MSAIDQLLEKVLEANERSTQWHRAVDSEWERLKQKHNERAGHAYGFTQHLEEMSKQAMASVKGDPRLAVFAIFDEVGDAFVKLTSEERSLLIDFAADCSGLERMHRGYISKHAAERLKTTRDVLWLWRGLAIAALFQGGTDFRDLHLALADVWDATRAAGLDPELGFRQIAAFASTKTGRGGLNGSMQDFLKNYRR